MELTAMVLAASLQPLRGEEEEGEEADEEAMELTAVLPLLPSSLPSLWQTAATAVAALGRLDGEAEEGQEEEGAGEGDSDGGHGGGRLSTERPSSTSSSLPSPSLSSAVASSPLPRWLTVQAESPLPPSRALSGRPLSSFLSPSCPSPSSQSTSMELTALVLPSASSSSSDPSACSADSEVDMEMTAILERWSGRGGAGEEAGGAAAVGPPSPSLSTRPAVAARSPARRLSSRLSLSSSISRASLPPSRLSVGDKTALLAARWEDILRGRQTAPSSSSGEEEDRKGREKADMGDATASIYHMLQAVLMDGQSTALAAQHATANHSLQQQQHTYTQSRATTSSPSPLSSPPHTPQPSPRASTARTSTPPPPPFRAPSAPPSLSSPQSPPPSPVSPGSIPSSPSATSAPSSPSLPAVPLSSAALLVSSFHLLGLSSLDDANLQCRLKKRDSEFSRGGAVTQHTQDDGDEEEEEGLLESAAAAAGGGRWLLAELRCALSLGPRVEALQGACAHLMDANAQIRDDSEQQTTALTRMLEQAHEGDKEEPLLNPLHALLRQLQLSSASASQPLPRVHSQAEAASLLPSNVTDLAPPSLQSSVLGYFQHCTRLARLTWLRWHRQLVLLLLDHAQQSTSRLSSDVDVSTDLRGMQRGLQRTREEGLRDEQQQQARRALQQLQLDVQAAKAALSAAEAGQSAWREEQGRLALRVQSASLALPSVVAALSRSLSQRGQVRRLRGLLAEQLSIAGLTIVHCSPAAKLTLHLMHPPVIALHCTPVDAAGAEPVDVCPSALFTVSCEPLPTPPASVSSTLCPALSAALCACLRSQLELSGRGVSASALPLLLRRCASVAQRAWQWQRSAQLATAAGKGRVLASWMLPSTTVGSAVQGCDALLSLRVLSADRRVQVVCRCAVSWTEELRAMSSLLQARVDVYSSATTGPARKATAALPERVQHWMSAERQAGYGPVQRMAAAVAALIDVAVDSAVAAR